MRAIVFWFLLVLATPGWAAHAYSLWGDIKYPPGFAHFDYVNPKAPKGGELVAVSNLRVSTFDKYNPFTIKGSVPAYLSEMLFESLFAGFCYTICSICFTTYKSLLYFDINAFFQGF